MEELQTTLGAEMHVLLGITGRLVKAGWTRMDRVQVEDPGLDSLQCHAGSLDF